MYAETCFCLTIVFFLPYVLPPESLREKLHQQTDTTANGAYTDVTRPNRHCFAVWKNTSFLLPVVLSVLMIKAVLKVNICNCPKYKMTFVA